MTAYQYSLSAALSFTILLFLSGLSPAQVPSLPDIPKELPDVIRQPLEEKRSALDSARRALLDEGARQSSQCRSVGTGTAERENCIVWKNRILSDVQVYRTATDALWDEIDAVQDNERVITAMNALAAQPEWSTVDRPRLINALRSLSRKGDAVSDNQINETWRNMLARGHDEVLAREASRGSGPGFPGAGQQTGYQDCAVFALANAAGLPYGVVAARAADLVHAGEWRTTDERGNPQKVIEQAGLNGGEVVMLTEAFGRVEVVPGAKFREALKKGLPVMVNVVPPGGKGGHQVVLTKTFQHAGKTWYEVMDSNQGPLRRLYLSQGELNIILQENGVVYQPEPETVPKLLRAGETP